MENNRKIFLKENYVGILVFLVGCIFLANDFFNPIQGDVIQKYQVKNRKTMVGISPIEEWLIPSTEYSFEIRNSSNGNTSVIVVPKFDWEQHVIGDTYKEKWYK